MKLSLFNFHDVTLCIAMSFCLLLAVVQLFHPDKNPSAKYFLVAFLLNTAVGIGAVLLFWQTDIHIHPLVDIYLVPYLLLGSLLLKGPLLYGYICAATTRNYRLTLADSIHAIPIILYFFLLFFSHQGSESDASLLYTEDKINRVLAFYEWHSVKIIPLIYAMMAAQKAWRHSKHCANTLRPLSLHGSGWLLFISTGALLNWAWSLGTHMLGIYFGPGVADGFGIADNYFTFGFVSTLLVYTLLGINRQLSESLNSPHCANGVISEDQLLRKIIHCMEEEKLFLNPRLNIERLAEHIQVSYRDVSALINHHFHTNFNEYINRYRINEAKRLLSDTQCQGLSIQEIYTRAGFNSKSAFHRFFNRLVGVSPREFRRLSAAAGKTNPLSA